MEVKVTNNQSETVINNPTNTVQNMLARKSRKSGTKRVTDIRNMPTLKLIENSSLVENLPDITEKLLLMGKYKLKA